MRSAKFDFEVHVTVSESADTVALEQVAIDTEAKVTEIILARGQTPLQPMITFRGTGTLRSQLKRAERTIRRLRRKGIGVVRIKVEVGLQEAFFETGASGGWSRRAEPPDWLYAEQHIRVRLRTGDSDRLRHDALRLGAHVSTNARASTGFMEERFVTSRVYNTADNFPQRSPQTIDTWSHSEYRILSARFETVAEGLRDAGWGIVDGDRELVVHDTNFELDQGWLPETEAQARQADYVEQSPASWPQAWTLPADPDLEQPRLFDPSMKHLSSAYRRGDPTGPGSHDWLTRRSQIFETILSAVAGSPLRESLCIRGSVLLRRYLGDVSRVPGDIDWVVLPATVKVNDEHGRGIIEALKQLLSESTFSGAALHVDDAVLDSIWTYDRVPGRRLTIPWSSDDIAPGTVQMDFVYGEELWTPPVQLALNGTTDLHIKAASPELSLAWKLLWLATDMHPQGKDLYDAVLLAEAHEISEVLIERAFSEASQWTSTTPIGHVAGRSVIDSWPVDAIEWETLIAEYPQIEGTASQWKNRLANAIFPPIS